MVLPCHLTKIRGQCALGIALASHACLPSTAIQMMLVLRVPYSHDDCQGHRLCGVRGVVVRGVVAHNAFQADFSTSPSYQGPARCPLEAYVPRLITFPSSLGRRKARYLAARFLTPPV